MAETNEIVQSVIDKITTGAEKLAEKLGVAVAELGKVAAKVWVFSVTAKMANAKAKMAKSAALLLLPVFLFGWSLHIVLMPIPHEVHISHDYEQKQSDPRPCDQVGTLNGKQTILHEQCWQTINVPVEHKDIGDVSTSGWLLVASGFIALIAGLIFLAIAIEGLIDGYAATKTAEYDAYQDLIYDWKD